MSRGTPASENQSPRQTTREHKGVNDKQMKGRISDTCSLPLFLCLPPSLPLPPSLSLSLQPVFPLLSSNNPLPHCLFFSVHGLLTEVGVDEARFSTSYKHRDAPLVSSCLCFLPVFLSLPCRLHRMTMNRTLSTVPATWNRLCTCLPLFLSVSPAPELVCHSE